jgi:hypothetical protein
MRRSVREDALTIVVRPDAELMEVILKNRLRLAVR